MYVLVHNEIYTRM